MTDPFAAGWADGSDDKPLTPAEIAQMVQLHARHLRHQTSGGRAPASPADTVA